MSTRNTRDERGFSLVELVITLALVSGVAIIASTIFVTALRGDKQVSTTTQATMQAQSVAQGIERSVRNAKRIAVSGSTVTAWTTLGGDRNCQRWSVVGSGASAKLAYTQGATTLGTATPFTGTAAVSGATLALTDASAGGVAGLRYVVTLPSETKPVKVSGTVRSRTPMDTTTAACGLS